MKNGVRETETDRQTDKDTDTDTESEQNKTKAEDIFCRSAMLILMLMLCNCLQVIDLVYLSVICSSVVLFLHSPPLLESQSLPVSLRRQFDVKQA